MNSKEDSIDQQLVAKKLKVFWPARVTAAPSVFKIGPIGVGPPLDLAVTAFLIPTLFALRGSQIRPKGDCESHLFVSRVMSYYKNILPAIGEIYRLSCGTEWGDNLIGNSRA